MLRYFFMFSLLLLSFSCNPPQEEPKKEKEQTKEMSSYSGRDVEWSGPGWYWGIWFTNADDFTYWKQHNYRQRRYYHRDRYPYGYYQFNNRRYNYRRHDAYRDRHIHDRERR